MDRSIPPPPPPPPTVSPSRFPGPICDLNIGSPVTPQPRAWRCIVCATLVGLVSVCCDWVRRQVWFATSVLQWQQKQNCPQDALTCRWDVNSQETKQPNCADTKITELKPAHKTRHITTEEKGKDKQLVPKISSNKMVTSPARTASMLSDRLTGGKERNDYTPSLQSHTSPLLPW